MGPCHLHLYHSSDFHYSPASPSFTCAFFSLKVLQLLAPLLHSYKPSLQHTQRSAFVFLPLTEPSGLDSPSSLCSFLSSNPTESTYCSHTHSKKEPPLLLAWFKSCSLIKLFKMCSWHFNTHLHFECDHTFQWKWKAMLKLAHYPNNSNVFFFFLRVAWKIYEKPTCLKWNHNLLQIHWCFLLITMSLFFFLPTKAKWHLIAIANIHWCGCEYKWDCWASCSHGNTSRMWCADWPWAAEFPFPHEFSSAVGLWVSAWQCFFCVC